MLVICMSNIPRLCAGRAGMVPGRGLLFAQMSACLPNPVRVSKCTVNHYPRARRRANYSRAYDDEMTLASNGSFILQRPRIVLFGDSLTERGFEAGGWAASLAHYYGRRVSLSLTCRWTIKSV
jgi:hypothetical protein